MNEQNFVLSNLQPDKPDSRDFIYSEVSYMLPESVDNRQWAGEIENQLQTGSCVANATVSSLELLAQRNGVNIDYSRMFLYYNLRAPYTELQGKDGGSYLRDGFKSINQIGICEEKFWPFVEQQVNTKPDQTAYDNSIYKVTEYQRINEQDDNTIKSMKTAIANGYPLIIALTLDKSFYYLTKPLNSQNYKGTSLKEDIIGSHALNVVGYDDKLNSFIIENSWGSYWGDSGYCLISYDVIMKDCHDIWVCTGFNNFSFDVKYIQPKKNIKDKVIQFFKDYKNNKSGIIFLICIIISIFINIIMFFS